MTRQLLRFTFVLLMCLTLPLAVTAQVVDILDPNLRAAINRELGKAEGAAITSEEMKRLRRLDPGRRDIIDLTGLEYATNLVDLVLWDNRVTDLSPIAGLTQLHWIALNGNSVSDLSPLVGLMNLRTLYLHGNPVTDITPLRGLFNLRDVDLRNTFVLDLSPLVQNFGLSGGAVILVSGTPLSNESIKIHIPALRERGVRVDNITIIFSLNPIFHYPAFVGVGDEFTIDLIGEDVVELAGWEMGFFGFDPSVLSVTSIKEGNFLKQGGKQVVFNEGTINNNVGEMTGTSSVSIGVGGVSGNGVLLSISFKAKAVGRGRFQLRNLKLININGYDMYELWKIGDLIVRNYDVNGDGNVTLDDLVLIGQNLGTNNSQQDVDGNGRVDIADLVAIAQYLGKSTTSQAPSAEYVPDLNSMMIQNWIDMAHAADDGSLAFQLGIANLKRLLEEMLPDKTALLANYPNPFNPETWIPYHLAHAADVTLTIYDIKGAVVRRLELGHQRAGYYMDRSQAAYWDGQSETGEQVASGVYFYQLQAENSSSEPGAGDFSAIRKMVILK